MPFHTIILFDNLMRDLLRFLYDEVVGSQIEYGCKSWSGVFTRHPDLFTGTDAMLQYALQHRPGIFICLEGTKISCDNF